VTKRDAVELKGVSQMCRPWFDSTLSVRSFGLLFLLLLVVPFPILAALVIAAVAYVAGAAVRVIEG